jgi:GT2 family glycosyltransferase
MMVTRRFLEDVGSMNETYFLYYEEIDWATRARRGGFHLGYAPDAIVYHKEGGTIGSSANRTKRSLMSEYYLIRSRLLFTRKYYPYFLPSVIVFSFGQIARHASSGDLRRFANGLRALLGLRYAPGQSK